MANKLYFKDSAVQITDTYATFGSKRFRLADITAVGSAAKDARPGLNNLSRLGIALIALGIFLFAGQLFLAGINSFVFQGLTVFVSMVGALILVVQQSTLKVYNVIRLSGSFGDAEVPIDRSTAQAQKIVQAIEAARKAQSHTPAQRSRADK